VFRSAPRRLLLAAVLALCAPATALAQSPEPVQLDGSPLNIWTNQLGSVQVSVDGFLEGEWYNPGPVTDPVTGNLGPNPNPNNGFGLVLYNEQGGQTYYGNYGGTDLPNPEGPTLQAGNPSTLNSAWTISNSGITLRVEQTLVYTNGSRQFDGIWRVTNLGGGGVARFRAGFLGDLAIRGSDSGTGFFEPGPPRFVGGVNPNVGAAGGFVEITPWSHFQVSRYSSASTAFSGTGFNDQVIAENVDNDMGVQWSNYEAPNPGLGVGETAEFRVGQRFVDTLGLDPVRATAQTGDEQVVRVQLGAINGAPEANVPLRWEVSGANPGEGTLTTNSEGAARLSWIGGEPGDDVLTVFRDANGDGDPGFDETQATSTITWEGPQGPIIGQTVNVREVSGTVKIQLPKGTSLAKAKALGFPPAATNKFINLSEALSVPVKSTLDTRRGTVRLLSAGLPQRNNSAFNGASFRGGVFKVGQNGNNPLTTLTAKGNLRCKRGARKSQNVSAARTRRLFGRGRGRFRTRGRRSSATVRGTAWVQKDSCRGTLTVVRQGTVVVKDVAKRKPIVLRASGPKKKRRYFARAKR
jgi:hypothetical protein